jgi:hypothetical protein
MPLRVSTEYVTVAITGPDAAALTLGQIEMLVTSSSTPTGGVWKPADVWAGGEAKLLVGPTGGTINWPTGQMLYVFVRITASPEQVVLGAGRLTVEDSV